MTSVNAPMNDPDQRVERLARGVDFSWVVRPLIEQRDRILARWLESAAAQPFHQERPEGAVADHIPQLFDVLVALLERATAARDHDDQTDLPHVPSDDPDVCAAAEAHARTRLAQGLTSADIVTEFRLLRQEIGRAIRESVPEDAPPGDVVGAQLVVNDALDGAVFLSISTLAQREAERIALDAARQAMETERERFIAAITHDLNNPLATIKGTTQLLHRRTASGAASADEIAQGLEAIADAATQMGAQIAELADVMRLREGQSLLVHRAPVDLVALIRRVVAGYQASTGAHQIHFACDETTIIGEWDQARLTRVLDNVLQNAIKYSPGGGPVEIALRRERLAGVDHAVLTVRDEGVGIPAADLPHIFEPYRRASNVVKIIPGSGIGLYAVRQVLEHHGGSITVESEEHQGSTFVIRLPIDG